MKHLSFLLLVAVVGCKQEKPDKLSDPFAWMSPGELILATPEITTNYRDNPGIGKWQFRLEHPVGWYMFSIQPEHYQVCFTAPDYQYKCEAVDEGFRDVPTIDYLNLGGTK